MKKKIFITLLVAVISLLVISGAYFIFRHSLEEVEPNDSSEQVVFSPEPLLTAPELSLEQEIFDKAVKDVNIDLCGDLKSDFSRNMCYSKVALQGDGEFGCSLINNEMMKSDCLDELKMQIAFSDKDLKKCSEISSEGIARFCVAELSKEKNAEDCKELTAQSLNTDCLTTINYQAAKIAKNANLCREIPDRMVMSNCLSEILDIDNLSDADGDGLKFFEEILNGTDPDKPDSDGDGYLDADEVSAGYNPTGEGLAAYNYLNCQSIEEVSLREACLLESENGRIDYQNCSELKNKYLRNYCLKKLEK